MWQRVFQYVQISVLLGVLWVILNERLDGLTFFSGVGVGMIAVALTNRLVLRDSYRRRYFFRSLPAVIFFLRLLLEIYIAGFSAVVLMLTGRVRVGLVDIRTDLEDDLGIALLANAITLTPGTVTMETDGQNMKVIWLNPQSRDPDEAGEAIKGLLERMLRSVVRR